MLVFKLNFKCFLIMTALAMGLMSYEFPPKIDKDTLMPCPSTAAMVYIPHGTKCLDENDKVVTIGEVNPLTLISAGVARIVQEAEKGLVFITVTRMVNPPPDLFEHFFGGPRRFHPPRKGDVKRTVSASGFFVDLDNGYIVTNAHVVKDSENIRLTLANGEEYEGLVTGADENTDIAVIQVVDKDFNREGLDWLELTDSSSLRTGDFVVALGAPFGFKASVSFGIVSGLQRGNLRGLTALGNFIQTDAAINPGNSGGPLLNAKGQVIGVNSAIYSVSGGYNGLGFAVPSEIVKKVTYQLVDNGAFERGYLGIALQELAPNQRKFFKVESGEQGVIIAQLADDGPAAKAGLKVRDVIFAIDGQKVSTPFELANAVGFNPPGTVIEVSYLRDGERLIVKIELGKAPNMKEKTKKTTATLWGLSLEEVQSNNESGMIDRGILVLSSQNIKSDVRRGDVIVAVDNIEVQGLAWLTDYLKDKKEVVLYLNRNGQYLFVTLQRD